MYADLAIGSPRSHMAVGSPRVRPEAVPDAEALHLAPEARHLAPEALPRWRALLETHWRARLERVTELSLAYHDAQETPGQAGDGQAAAAMAQAAAAKARPLLRQAVTERRELAEIEAALARLSAGSFGRCERCGGAVAATRLTRVPQARYCGSCGR
jgi:RNA polymerase-binding transcription factor DksA